MINRLKGETTERSWITRRINAIKPSVRRNSMTSGYSIKIFSEVDPDEVFGDQVPIEIKKQPSRPPSSDSFYRGGMQFENDGPFLKQTVFTLLDKSRTAPARKGQTAKLQTADLVIPASLKATEYQRLQINSLLQDYFSSDDERETAH